MKAVIQQEQEFKAFDLLKFPLAVMVVYLHGHITETTVGGVHFSYEVGDFPIYGNISYFISEFLSYLAVPAFFFIAGYLFCKGLNNGVNFIDKTKYAQKLKRRIKTLLVPYLLWNIIYLGLFFCGQTLFPGLISGENELIKDYGFGDFMNAFWAGNDGYPICSPLWFVRDIIVMIALTPLFLLLFKHLKVVPLVLLLALWLLNVKTNIVGLDFKSMLFFYGGGYFGYTQVSPISMFKPFWKPLVFFYTIASLLSMLCLNQVVTISSLGTYSNRLSLVVGVPVLLLIGYLIAMKKEKTPLNDFLKSSNFFIFAYHILPLNFVIKLFLKTMAPGDEWSILFVYISSPVITIIIGLLLFLLLKTITPQVTSLLTGGRN